MKVKLAIIPLFEQFIKESKNGKRLKKNGEQISEGTIKNYTYVLNNLRLFTNSTGIELRICDASRLNKRERLSEKNYWKKFYKKFTLFLYKKGCHDNYVGITIKQIRTFLNWLKYDKDFNTGDYQKILYIRKEEINILVLSPEQLKFLIHDKEFNRFLSPAEKKVKDIFVFGCTTGLRFSDLFNLTSKNIEVQNGDYYLNIKSQKTKTSTGIKLPKYAVEIYQQYKPRSVKKNIFPKITLFIFNRTLKNIGKKAGFTSPISLTREQLGKPKQLTKKEVLFCDKMSSHMMRRTAITTLLILGMPEHLVRKISGHSSSSSSFNRYVHYAQTYIDKEIDKIHQKLEEY
ncbi:tyrosine-type recombinase/integrase [Mesonia maritima]|uniref:Integrase n=1 Tax=Mesonia maritima TaxID=1793873 RepID=A0ABU1K9N6_9FLAO|nr:tyrosine-type recombinase/integrase [Mesonia maritima]MDR6302306.1 integrase [Mesonia maritima]